MDKTEAVAIAERELSSLRDESWADLVRLVARPEWRTATGSSGQSYEIQILGLWDSGTENGNLRVLAAVGDGSVGRFVKPLVSDFIITPAGEFLGE